MYIISYTDMKIYLPGFSNVFQSIYTLFLLLRSAGLIALTSYVPEQRVCDDIYNNASLYRLEIIDIVNRFITLFSRRSLKVVLLIDYIIHSI